MKALPVATRWALILLFDIFILFYFVTCTMMNYQSLDINHHLVLNR